MKIVRFAIVGVTNTVADYSVYWLMLTLGVPPQISNIISTSLAAVFSFTANRLFTFAETRASTGLATQMWKHASVTGSALLLTAAIIHLLAEPLGPLAAKALAIPVVFMWNYMLSSSWVWPSQPSGPAW